jgi:hypothetical protein
MLRQYENRIVRLGQLGESSMRSSPPRERGGAGGGDKKVLRRRAADARDLQPILCAAHEAPYLRFTADFKILFAGDTLRLAVMKKPDAFDIAVDGCAEFNQSVRTGFAESSNFDFARLFERNDGVWVHDAIRRMREKFVPQRGAHMLAFNFEGGIKISKRVDHATAADSLPSAVLNS